jgi:8-oxo-dGTP pyrophosphatase MutT (NUDIX family)
MDTKSAINLALSFPSVGDSVRTRMQSYLATNTILTKGEGNPHHVNAFFLPYDKKSGKIFLGHHIKANDWIPPGGHIEPGESPEEACIREMQEELFTTIAEDQLELWNLSYKQIDRPEKGCVGHYDLWYLVHIDSENDFAFDPGEFYAAGWFTIPEGLKKITKNPDFVEIISGL